MQVTNEQVIEKAQETTPRRSKRKKRPAISSDYVVHSLEHECELSINDYPISFRQAMESGYSKKWLNVMKEELKSMDDNKVWDLIELLKGSK